MNDVLRLFFADFEYKQPLEYSLAGLTASSGYIFKMPLLNNEQNNISLGSGMALGTFWANTTESKQPTSLINPAVK